MTRKAGRRQLYHTLCGTWYRALRSDGGVNNYKLYEGSTFRSTWDTHLICVGAYLSDAAGNKVWDGSVNGQTVTFSSVILPPDGHYTVNLVLERQQQLQINVTTSTSVDATGAPVGGASTAYQAAYALLKEKNTAGKTVTVGYTGRTGKASRQPLLERNVLSTI